MSLHRSLKTTSGALNQHRNVLTRAERIERLTALGRFQADSTSPLGLVKVSNRAAAKKKKVAKEETEGAAVEEKPAEEKK